MGSEFPRSPRLLKGGLVVFQSQTPGPPPRIVVFQYNPEQMTRSLALRAAPRDASNVGAAREDVLRVLGPPVETMTLSIELDAADQLAEPETNPNTLQYGLHPALATLELLLYPPISEFELSLSLANSGTVQITPADLPLVLLVWGASRVVPVMLTTFSITEQFFDPQLNPIQAKVELGLRVLTYMELKDTSIGYDTYLGYQRQKEILASLYQPGGDGTRLAGLLPM